MGSRSRTARSAVPTRLRRVSQRGGSCSSSSVRTTCAGGEEEDALFCHDAARVLRRRRGGGFVGENAEDLVEAGDVENRAHTFAQTEKPERAAVGHDALERLDENGEAGAVDVADVRQVDEQARHLFREERRERGANLRRAMQIDFAFESEDAVVGLWS